MASTKVQAHVASWDGSNMCHLVYLFHNTAGHDRPKQEWEIKT